MKFCVCGLVVGEIRLPDGGRQAVEPWPIHYRQSDSGSMRLMTLDGQLVRAASCRPEDKEGIGYPLHRCPGVLT